MPSLLKWLFKSFAYGKLDCLLNSKFLWGFPGSSAGKESACNAGDPGSIPGSNPGEGIRLPTPVFLGFPGGSDGKESACNAEDLGLIPGLGRSPGEGNDYPFQYSCLENPTDRGAWWAAVTGVAMSQARLGD